MVFIPKNSTLGLLGCAHMPTIILLCTLPLFGGPWCGHGGFFFVMIRMARATHPDYVQWIQNRTEGKYFCMQVGCDVNLVFM
jgi:hypothetical protein